MELEEKVLKEVKKNPDHTISSLAKKLKVSRVRLSYLLSEYEKRGLIKRVQIGASKAIREASK